MRPTSKVRQAGQIVTVTAAIATAVNTGDRREALAWQPAPARPRPSGLTSCVRWPARPAWRQAPHLGCAFRPQSRSQPGAGCRSSTPSGPFHARRAGSRGQKDAVASCRPGPRPRLPRLTLTPLVSSGAASPNNSVPEAWAKLLKVPSTQSVGLASEGVQRRYMSLETLAHVSDDPTISLSAVAA
jgi:hypothetical protein